MGRPLFPFALTIILNPGVFADKGGIALFTMLSIESGIKFNCALQQKNSSNPKNANAKLFTFIFLFLF